jgi:hypothetical protein
LGVKNCLTLAAILFAVFTAKPQASLTAHLEALKGQGKLNGTERIFNPSGGTTTFKISRPSQATAISTACNCWIPRDSTFSVVPFDGSGASGGPGVPPYYANDDWSTGSILLPFSFCLYGTTYTSLYINNNGNVSFGAPYSTFSAVAFPSNQYVMIATFWSDVDTRDVASKYVHYKLTPSALIIQWDSVGYYLQHSDKVNTYQLILTNGADSILPAGNNLSFCYKDMQWTTGDASGGANGFGGTPATVGANKGDGINYFQAGLFDHAGTSYDGSVGNNDGVDWLDNRSIVANVCGSSTNIPPVAIDSICDTVVVNLMQTISLVARFLSGDAGQTCTITPGGGTGFAINNNISGNMASVYWQFTGSAGNVGYNTVTFTALDNGTGANTTTITKVIQVLNSLGAESSADLSTINVFPNPSLSVLNIALADYPKAFVSIRSVLGNKVLSKEITNQNNFIDVFGLENGVYLAEINVNGRIINKLFIKE